ncbi:MAG TPA: twin-arginine translocase subunit TatC [Verrucomicrobiae bacterium]|nr:twin-arginine translocase subunit TatC [Verrucomicrobiae bacterium]
MAAAPIQPPPDDLEDDGGGPVKSFLEHLEDFRWLIIKIAAALGLSLFICLYAVPQIVAILKWPLAHAALVRVNQEHRALVQLGPNTITTLRLGNTNQIAGYDLGTNWFTVIRLEPVTVGSNVLLSVHIDNDPSTEAKLSGSTDLIYLDPSAPFFSSMTLAFYGGILLSSPFIFFFLAQFILPALKVKEKKYAMRAAFLGATLFLAGVALCYFFVLARALKFAEWWALWMGVQVPDWRAETYFAFVTKFLIGMGLGFELPVLILALVKIGLLDYAKLAAFRRYMIIVNLILGALLTTPEVFTQAVMAIVLQILYEVSVWVAWYWEQPDRAKARRALFMVLLLVALAGGLVWAGIQYGWPWAQQHLHHSGH